jgi:hypothetical protein
VHRSEGLVLSSGTYEDAAQQQRFENKVLAANVGRCCESVAVGPTWLPYATKQQHYVDRSQSPEPPHSVLSGQTAKRQRVLRTVMILGSGGNNSGEMEAMLGGGTVACGGNFGLIAKPKSPSLMLKPRARAVDPVDDD